MSNNGFDMGDKENPKTTAAGKAESKWTATPQSHKSPIYAHTSPTRTPSPVKVANDNLPLNPFLRLLPGEMGGTC